VPKLKTHKATAKRFKVSGTGKLLRSHMPKGHLRRRRAKRLKRALDRTTSVDNFEVTKHIRQLAPYLKND
jgi:large subunit ribosomal protein L35